MRLQAAVDLRAWPLRAAAARLGEWALGDVSSGGSLGRFQRRRLRPLLPLLPSAPAGDDARREAARELPASLRVTSTEGKRAIELSRAWRWLTTSSAAPVDAPTWVPIETWDVVATAAWSEPRLQYELALRFRAELRDSVLFAPGSMPQIVLLPSTLWFALATSPVLGLGRRATRFGAGLRQLRRIAENRALVGHQAGFWDQWLIAEWLHAGSDGNVSAGMAAAAAGLPIMQCTRYDELRARLSGVVGSDSRRWRRRNRGARRRVVELARRDWEASMPAWMPIFLGRRR